MRVLSLVGVLLLMSPSWAGDPAPMKLSFAKAKVGELPAGWKSGVTGTAEGSVWKIVEDKTAPGGPLVLAQTSKSPGPVFNLCVFEDGKYKEAGKIGLWTKADAQTYFADIQITAKKE